MAESPQLFVLADADLPEENVLAVHSAADSLAAATGRLVRVAAVRAESCTAILGHMEKARLAYVLNDALPPPPSAPMSSAEFLWRDDGRPDWGSMWTGFCELALYGGPPHRGDEQALHAPAEAPLPAADDETIAEIRRGIWETTGLFAEPAEEPGWISVTCDSPQMAAWLCASI
jgi:hypothetical protein